MARLRELKLKGKDPLRKLLKLRGEKTRTKKRRVTPLAPSSTPIPTTRTRKKPLGGQFRQRRTRRAR